MIGDNEVKDSRGVRLLSKISLYEVYQVDTRTNKYACDLVQQDVVATIHYLSQTSAVSTLGS
jgi:hypothetical protein